MTTGKRQPPLWLDMDFGGALARFAGTDPKEVTESMERSKVKKPPSRPLLGGVEVEQNLKPVRGRKRKPVPGA